MLIAKIFKNGKQIDQGIVDGYKAYHPDYPEQSITICTDTNEFGNERRYKVENGIEFKVYQDNGNGWEEVYCSIEKVDRSVEYPLPDWFVSCRPIPNITHRMNEDGEIEETHRGYFR